MADPLTQVADQFAPAPLNFFDPAQAQSIIARHADSRRGLESSQEAVKPALQLYDLERSQERDARDKILQSRQDQEWNDHQDARLQRGAFIDSLSKELDHNDPDYNTKVLDFLKTVPPSVMEDSAFKDILAYKNREADKADAERRRQEDIALKHQNNLELAREKAKQNGLYGYIKPEDWKNAPRDENGNPDAFWLASKAIEGKRAAELEDYGKKTDIRTNAAKELLDVKKMDDAQKALFHETRDILSSDKEAFPDRLDAVRYAAQTAGVKMPDKDLKTHPTYADRYRVAEEWDKNKFRNEVNTAKKYATPEEYIPFNGPDGKPVSLSETAQNARRRLWEYAHQNDSKEGAASAPATTGGTQGTPPTDATAPASTPILVPGADGSQFYKNADGKWIRRVPVQ